MAWKPRPYKFRPVQKIISSQDRKKALNKVVADLIENLGIEEKRIDGWHLQINYTEDNPEYLAYMADLEIYKAKEAINNE